MLLPHISELLSTSEDAVLRMHGRQDLVWAQKTCRNWNFKAIMFDSKMQRMEEWCLSARCGAISARVVLSPAPTLDCKADADPDRSLKLDETASGRGKFEKQWQNYGHFNFIRPHRSRPPGAGRANPPQ
jgi:hypothetical protein